MAQHRRILIFILSAYVILATLYSIVTPLFEASDELWHYPMVKYLADNGLQLPPQDPANPGPWRQEGSQPPLYYLLAAVLTAGIDTSDMAYVRRVNPHADIGIMRPDGNANMIVHRPGAEEVPWRGTTLAVHLVRFFSIALGLGTVLVTYQLAREIFPAWPLMALGAAALNAFLPMFLFISGSVNNDNLSNLLGNLLTLLIVRLLKNTSPPAGESPVRVNSPGLRDYALIGVVTGAGLLAKLNIGFLIPLVALALLVVSLRRRDWRPLVVGGLVSGGLTILIAGGWYLRNWQLYNDPTGLTMFLQMVGVRAMPANLAQLWSERHSFTQAFWGFFGGVNVPLPDPVYLIFNLIGGLSLLSALVFLIYQAVKWLPGSYKQSSVFSLQSSVVNKHTPVASTHNSELPSPLSTQHSVLSTQHSALSTPQLLPAAITLIWPLVTFISFLRWTAETPASQGRLVFGALSSICLWLAVGLLWWLPKRWQPVMMAGTAGYFAIVAALALFLVIAPAYALPASIQPGEPQAIFSEPGTSGGIGLLDARIISEQVQPEDYVQIVTNWQIVQPLSRDWSLFVHLVTPDGVIVAQRDVYPGGGTLATSDLPAGRSWSNPVAVWLPPATYAPVTLEVVVGWYHLPTGDRLRLANGTETLTVGQVELLPRRSEFNVPNPISINFDNQLELVGYSLTDLSPRAGDTIELTLHWRGLRKMDADYKVFANVLDPQTLTKYAASDAMPVQWQRPTTTWTPGEIIEDTHTLTVDPNTPPGIYDIQLGLYREAPDGTFPRLRIVTPDGGMAFNFTTLSRVRVLPREDT
ncbi:MAG: glycosyltransferase family 39 protein [Chloroflexi bacterium]|nr:glycosyltransferase family 39 protein [Chloroflexota bacterium]